MNGRIPTGTARLSRQGILNRWGLAAAFDARLPQLRGRDRLLHLVRGTTTPKPLRSSTVIRWGPGLEATVNPSLDGSLQALYVAQWLRPALMPILEACLEPGDIFVDVGANVGVYSTWAAGIVGPRGTVLALEPIPTTRAWLEKICSQNKLDNINILATAVGEQEGFAWMQTTEGASGLSRVVTGASEGLKVPITTLDQLLGSKVPGLIKIDVEGHEFSVLKGARRTLETTGVPVAFEAPEFGGGTGTIDCVRHLESIGYHVFSLTPRGLRAFDPVAYSHNLLAINRADTKVAGRLRRARFARSQNT